MQNVWKFFFKDPLSTDLRGLSGNGIIIYEEAVKNSDLRNHAFTLNPGWDMKSAGDHIWLMKQIDKNLRIIIAKDKIDKVELRFE